MHQINDAIVSGGRVVLSNLPFPDGQRLRIVVAEMESQAIKRIRNRMPRSEVSVCSSRRRLPKLPIPLKTPDPNVILDLTQAVETTFNSGRFEQNLLYNKPVPASLAEADQAWVAERLKGSENIDPVKA